MTLEVIYGPMFSGKTEELIRRIRVASPARVAAFKPVVDTRGPSDVIVSHTGASYPAQRVGSAADVIAAAEGATIVAVDEAQFFDVGLLEVVEDLRRVARVIVAGLDSDYRRQPFGVIPELIARADNATRLYARCEQCGGSAEFTQRLRFGQSADAHHGVIAVGGHELYEARCATCYRQPASDLAVR